MSDNPKENTKEWWDHKYLSSNDFLYGKAPSNFLQTYLSHLKPGDSLDLGMGEGQNAVFLALKGHDVTGVDFSSVATERARKLAKDSGVEMTIKNIDLDFFLIPLMKYTTIVCSNIRPPLTTLKNLARGLAPGGTLVMEAPLYVQGVDAFESYKSNELLDFVKELQLLYYSELKLPEDDRQTIRLIAKKNIKM